MISTYICTYIYVYIFEFYANILSGLGFLGQQACISNFNRYDKLPLKKIELMYTPTIYYTE